MTPIIIISALVILMMIGAGFLYRKRRGKFAMANFLQTMGIDLSEGIEALIYGIRTILLLVLEFVFAHLEAQTLASVMPYREGAYEMGLAMALVAMIAGMTFATELNLQTDRRRSILPAINRLKIGEQAKNTMLHTYHRTYKAHQRMMIISLFVSIGMHAAIVIMAQFSLWQHEAYAIYIMQGGTELPGMPALHYTVWFNWPLVLSSSLIGTLGFVIDLILGMTSNIKEELYKYKPNPEILETTAEIEAEFGNGSKPNVDNKEDEEDDDDEEPDDDLADESDLKASDIAGAVDALMDSVDKTDHEISLNYTGTEETEKLMRDFVEVIVDNEYFSQGIAEEIDIEKLVNNYESSDSDVRKNYTKLTKSLYSKIQQTQIQFDNTISKLQTMLKRIVILLDEKKVSEAAELYDEAEDIGAKYTTAVAKARGPVKSLLVAYKKLTEA